MLAANDVAAVLKSQSVPRDGGYCNAVGRVWSVLRHPVSIRPEGRGVLQLFDKISTSPRRYVSIRPEGRGVLQQ